MNSYYLSFNKVQCTRKLLKIIYMTSQKLRFIGLLFVLPAYGAEGLWRISKIYMVYFRL